MAQIKYWGNTASQALVSKVKTELGKKVDKVDGKQLSTEDFTTALKTKLEGVAAGSQVNVIESVKVNGAAQTITSKAVDITVPTKVSELTNDSNYVNTTQLAAKVDKVDGKGLSTNDLTDELKQKYDNTASTVEGLVATGGQANVIESITVNGTTAAVDANKNVAITIPTNVSSFTNDANYLVAADIANKVDKVEGKGLSTNDYTTAEKTKLAGVAEGAQVNVIETVKVNGTAQAITDKVVNITVPTQTSDLTDFDTVMSDYATNDDLSGEVATLTAAIGTKVATSTYNEGMALKADKTQVASDISTAVADKVSTSDLENALAAAVASVYKVKGTVANEAALPDENNTVGDVYNVTDTGMNYVWTGEEWDALGSFVDLSAYAKTADFVEMTAAEVEAMW